MGKARFWIAFLALWTITALLAQASGFENSGVGLKARAMGGAFRAVADDWTAAYYNPAGYAYLADNQLGGILSLVHQRLELVPEYRWGGRFETGIFNDRTNFNKHEILSLPAAGLVVRMPLWGETVFGLSAYQPFDYNVTWTLFDPPDAYNNDARVPDDQFLNNLDVVAFQLTAARATMNDKYSFGLGLQLLRGDLVFNNILFRDNPLKDDPTTATVVWARPREKIAEFNHNDGNGWGFGLTAGCMWQVNEKLNMAAAARVPFDLRLSGSAVSQYYMPDDSTLWHNSDSVEISSPGTVGQLFLSGSTVSDNADFEATLRLPPSIAVGVSFKPIEKLTIALDGEYTFWSRFNGLDFTYSNHTGLSGVADTSGLARRFFTDDPSFSVDWKNAGKVMAGARYEYRDVLTLLAGVSADQSPARDAGSFSPLFVDAGDKLGLNGGFIFHIERWDLGLATSYVRQPDLTISASGDFGSQDNTVNFPGGYQAATYETILSFNYTF
ncbi:MAG TPA: outer membrane protein transport protein [Candidatus Deferrimicrobium sp.]|nr:outer membrane protein transport protein [Candidatus Deferrimicrobium sp.]